MLPIGNGGDFSLQRQSKGGGFDGLGRPSYGALAE
jgi:hypothetical protein